jgi:hypothetical protein
MPKPKIRVMLDSGAYSAWTHNKSISLPEYIQFIEACKDHVWLYVNLDVIPGSIDRKRTEADTSKAAKQSYANLQKMKEAGLKPLPVFHQGEDWSWLEKMIEDGEEYIGISTAKNQPNIVQEKWLDKFFSVVTNRDGRPVIKVHGFGSAHVTLLKRHPYYSVDSAGWRIAAAYGKMYVPPYHAGKPQWLMHPFLVTMTGNYQESPHSQARQLEKLGEREQDMVRKFLEEEVGVNVGMARYSDRTRYRALAVYYQKVADAIRDIRFTSPVHSMIRQMPALLVNAPPVKFKHLNFVFSTAYDLDCCTALLEAKADLHLLSYWELKNRPEVLETYAQGKVITARPPAGIKADWDSRRYIAHRGRSLAKRMRDHGEQSNEA